MCLPERNENTCPYKGFYKKFKAALFVTKQHHQQQQPQQKLKTIQKSVSWRMDKQIVVHSYNRIIFNNIK